MVGLSKSWEMAKYRNVIKNHVTIRSGSWETRSATHGWPPWFATVKRCNLKQKLCGFPSQPNPLRGRQKGIAHPLLESPRGLVRRRKKDPTTQPYSLTVTHPRTNPARPGLTSDAGFEKLKKQPHRRIKRRIRKLEKNIFLFIPPR